MTEDVTPGLLKKIKKEFDYEFNNNQSIISLYEKVKEGTATYKEANMFAIEIGDILAKAFQNNLSSDVLPDGKMYYNIAKRIIEPMLKNNFDLIVEVTDKVQTALNKSISIRMKAITPKFNNDRVEGIINKVSSADKYDEVSWVLDEPIKNFTQNIVDNAIQLNAKFQYDSGLNPKIVRKLAGNCCDWCKQVVGTYTYPNVPRDVYRRHQRCRCTIEYHVGKFKQDVHSKRWYGQDSNRMTVKKLLQMDDNELTDKEKKVKKQLLNKTSAEYEKKRKEERIQRYMELQKVSHRRASNRLTRLKNQGLID